MKRLALVAAAALLSVCALDTVSAQAREAECADHRPWAPVGVRHDLADGSTLYRVNPVLRCGRQAASVRIDGQQATPSLAGTWVLSTAPSGGWLHVTAKAPGEPVRHGYVRFKDEGGSR